MSHKTDSMAFEIFVGISFSSLLLFPGHGGILTVDYVLSLQATFKGWMDIMYDAIDSRGVSNVVIYFG